MAFSLSRLIISKSDGNTCGEAFMLVNETLPQQVTQRGTTPCVGKIGNFDIWLWFWKGIPSWKCSCRETAYAQSSKPCAHAIALAIAWDRNRNVPDPSNEDVEFLTRKH